MTSTANPVTQPSPTPTALPTTTLDGNLIYHSTFDGTADDISGNQNHGTLHNVVSTYDKNGNANSALQFNGNSAYVELSNGRAFNFANNFTISFYIKPGSSQLSYANILDKGHSLLSGFTIEQNGDSTNNWGFGYFSSYNQAHSTAAIQYSAGQWSHIAIVKQDKITTTYVNGVSTTTIVATQTSVASNGNIPLVVGAWNAGISQPASSLGRFLNADMDEFRIYNISLPASSIVTLSNVLSPTVSPSRLPTPEPTTNSPTTALPTTIVPTIIPSGPPTLGPSVAPSPDPSVKPSIAPSVIPSIDPSVKPSVAPSVIPSIDPSVKPSIAPSVVPSIDPSVKPSIAPSVTPSIDPSVKPSVAPSVTPSIDPSVKPSVAPSVTPSVTPSIDPSVKPSIAPSVIPSIDPSVNPSVAPSVIPSIDPSIKPSVAPSVIPSIDPSVKPSVVPSVTPSIDPSVKPSVEPSVIPSIDSSVKPSVAPSVIPSIDPSVKPSVEPSVIPSIDPSVKPSVAPSVTPSIDPSVKPSVEPSVIPSIDPSVKPSVEPSVIPSIDPSVKPSVEPSVIPSIDPSVKPSIAPSVTPSIDPSVKPSVEPSVIPSIDPSVKPSVEPSVIPSIDPSVKPSVAPSVIPSIDPSVKPSVVPSVTPSIDPSVKPSVAPSVTPSIDPSVNPSVEPSVIPSIDPSVKPSVEPSVIPSIDPSVKPSVEPSVIPSIDPSVKPSVAPSVAQSPDPSVKPSVAPSVAQSPDPSVKPSAIPSVAQSPDPSVKPSVAPSVTPSIDPSVKPSVTPSVTPSIDPSVKPSVAPSVTPSIDPSVKPSIAPSVTPSIDPSVNPSVVPSIGPSVGPSFKPSFRPSLPPSVNPSFKPSTPPSIRPSLAPTPFFGTNVTLVQVNGNVTCSTYNEQYTILCGQFPVFCVTVANGQVVNKYNASTLTSIKSVIPMTAQNAIVLGQTKNQSTVAVLDYQKSQIDSKYLAATNTYSAVSSSLDGSGYSVFGINALNQLEMTQFNQSSDVPVSNTTYSMTRASTSGGAVFIKEIVGATPTFNGLLATTTTNLPLVILQDTTGALDYGFTFTSLYERNTIFSVNGIGVDPFSPYPIIWGATQVPNGNTNAFFYSPQRGGYQLLGLKNGVMSQMLDFNNTLYGLGSYGDNCIFVMRLDSNFALRYVQLCAEKERTCPSPSLVAIRQQIGISCNKENQPSIVQLDQNTLRGEINPTFDAYNNSNNLVSFVRYLILSWGVSISASADIGSKIWRTIGDAQTSTPTTTPTLSPTESPTSEPSEEPTTNITLGLTSNATNSNVSTSSNPTRRPSLRPSSLAPTYLRGSTTQPTLYPSQSYWSLFPSSQQTVDTTANQTSLLTSAQSNVSTYVPTPVPTFYSSRARRIPTPAPTLTLRPSLMLNTSAPSIYNITHSAANHRMPSSSIIITTLSATSACGLLLLYFFLRKNKLNKVSDDTTPVDNRLGTIKKHDQEDFTNDNNEFLTEEFLEQQGAKRAADEIAKRMKARSKKIRAMTHHAIEDWLNNDEYGSGESKTADLLGSIKDNIAVSIEVSSPYQSNSNDDTDTKEKILDEYQAAYAATRMNERRKKTTSAVELVDYDEYDPAESKTADLLENIEDNIDVSGEISDGNYAPLYQGNNDNTDTYGEIFHGTDISYHKNYYYNSEEYYQIQQFQDTDAYDYQYQSNDSRDIEYLHGYHHEIYDQNQQIQQYQDNYSGNNQEYNHDYDHDAYVEDYDEIQQQNNNIKNYSEDQKDDEYGLTMRSPNGRLSPSRFGLWWHGSRQDDDEQFGLNVSEDATLNTVTDLGL